MLNSLFRLINWPTSDRDSLPCFGTTAMRESSESLSKSLFLFSFFVLSLGNFSYLFSLSEVTKLQNCSATLSPSHTLPFIFLSCITLSLLVFYSALILGYNEVLSIQWSIFPHFACCKQTHSHFLFIFAELITKLLHFVPCSYKKTTAGSFVLSTC